MNAYAEMKKRHQEEVNALPMYWAFSDEQFDQQLKELGLTRNDTGKLCKTFGGGFCLASDAQMIADTLRGHRREMEEAISADETGDGFIKDMFLSELSNHEYTYGGREWQAQPLQAGAGTVHGDEHQQQRRSACR